MFEVYLNNYTYLYCRITIYYSKVYILAYMLYNVYRYRTLSSIIIIIWTYYNIYIYIYMYMPNTGDYVHHYRIVLYSYFIAAVVNSSYKCIILL